jgi:hypothetical protein
MFYFAQVQCRVRAELSDMKLRELVKARHRAHAALEAMRSHPHIDRSKPESEWTVLVRVRGPDGVVDKSIKISAMLEQSRLPASLSLQCKHCTANVRNSDYGCGGVIHQPLLKESEQWLIDRLPDDVVTRRGELLLKAISDLHITGAPIDAARNHRHLYLLKTPLKRSYGSFPSRKTISSSQIIQLLFGMGSLQSAQAKIVAFVMGFLDDRFKVDDRVENQPQEDDCDAVAELKFFLAAAAQAASNDVPLFIDG